VTFRPPGRSTTSRNPRHDRVIVACHHKVADQHRVGMWHLVQECPEMTVGVTSLNVAGDVQIRSSQDTSPTGDIALLVRGEQLGQSLRLNDTEGREDHIAVGALAGGEHLESLPRKGRHRQCRIAAVGRQLLCEDPLYRRIATQDAVWPGPVAVLATRTVPPSVIVQVTEPPGGKITAVNMDALEALTGRVLTQPRCWSAMTVNPADPM
jgi:hypothetical protein